MNGYSYAADDPVNGTDPDGEYRQPAPVDCTTAAECGQQTKQLLQNTQNVIHYYEQQKIDALKVETQYRCAGVSTDPNCGSVSWQEQHEVQAEYTQDLNFIASELKKVDDDLWPGFVGCDTGDLGDCVTAVAAGIGYASGLDGGDGDGLQPSCGGDSFTAATPVLTASGKAVPISSLKVGDKVVAADTSNGKDRIETVDAVLVHHDTNLYDLTVNTPHGKQIIDTTSNHLMWDLTTRTWVQAAHLHVGDKLLTADGSTATADGGQAPADSTGWMWDLTVDNLHTFYVVAGEIPVLVHNSNCVIGSEFGPDNPGPLADGVVSTFTDGKYSEVTTTGPTTLYRVYGGTASEMGAYWSRTLASSSAQAIKDSALDQSWGNTAGNWVSIEVPEGTTFYEGTAAPQGDLPGRGSQVFFTSRVDSAWTTGGGTY
jgi:hypothetical protein